MFTIVIPLYNKEQSIISTIQCVKRQNFRDFECIIVNDGSTDSSLANAETAIEGDQRFVLLNQNNRGVSAARNMGVLHSRYPFVAFLDADDYWDENYLAEAYALVKQFPHAVLYGVGWTYGTDNMPQSRDTLHPVERRKIENYWTQNNYSFWTSAAVVSKTAFLEIGGFDERITYGEDIDVWYRLLLAFPYAAAYSNRLLAYWMQDTENSLFHSAPPFERNLLCYMGKYDKDRVVHPDFRRFIDPIMAGLLFPYLDSQRYQNDASFRKQVASVRRKIDLRTLKPLCALRLYCPALFRIKRRITTIWKNISFNL